ncbi:MAG: hypothetical protein LBD82_04705, partial [Deltaproteobacteria bacterium]|nr:hypothetical protein [Deltaproteobacteria bacterium]
KGRLLAERTAQEQTRAEQQAKERAAAAERERLAGERAAMSEKQRLVADFCQKLAKHPALRPRDAGALILVECADFLERAVTWPEAEQRQCLEKMEPWLKAKNMILGRSQKEIIIKECLKKLRGAKAPLR